MCFVFLFSSCSDNVDDANNNIESDSTTELLAQSSEVTEAVSKDNSNKNSVALEDVTSEYVEPDFKIVKTLNECLNYFETEPTDTVEKETDSNGNVTSVTVKDSQGQIKGTITVKYNDDSIDTAVSVYADGEVLEKMIFIFTDEDSVSTIAHVDPDSNISVYLYNDDGTFNSYIDSEGFSALLSGTIMSGISGALFG